MKLGARCGTSWPRGSCFSYPELNDPPDQIGRKRLRQRELHRSLALLVRRQFFLEGLYATRDRVKADVICVAGEMDEMVAVEVEGWH